MKKENGITLIALVITIIVLSALLGVSLNYGIGSLTDARNTNYKSELNIVSQAVAEQYIKLTQLGLDKVTRYTITESGYTENGKPDAIVGQFLTPSTAKSTYYSDFLLDDAKAVKVTPGVETPLNTTNFYYVKAYYRLDAADLSKLKINPGTGAAPDDAESGIKKSSYIVNYYTGEVYNINKKLYLKGKNTEATINEGDTNPNTSIVDGTDFSETNTVYDGKI